MPAGDAERIRLKEAVKVLLLFTFQSTFGKKMRWFCVRGTAPVRLEMNAVASLIRASVMSVGLSAFRHVRLTPVVTVQAAPAAESFR